MGTNYYIKHKILQKQIDEVKKLIDKHEWSDAIYGLQELNENEFTHIGKSSYGWKFCFQYHSRYGPESCVTKDTIFNFIKESLENGCELVDEYGNQTTIKELDELIESKQHCQPHEQNWHTFKSKDNYDWGRRNFS